MPSLNCETDGLARCSLFLLKVEHAPTSLFAMDLASTLLIDDGCALLIDHQHQSLVLQGMIRISRVVRKVFCHLNLLKRY